MKYHILIVDDHETLSLGASIIIKRLLSDAEMYFASSVGECCEKLTQSPIDLILLDIDLPDGNNVKMIHAIRKILPEVKILMFSSYSEELYGIEYLLAGANGYISKGSSQDIIHEAVNAVLNKGAYINPKLKAAFKERSLSANPRGGENNPINLLTSREKEVMNYILSGKSTSEIAYTLNLALPTVSIYKSKIFNKFGVRDQFEMINKFKHLDI
jgi:two-component system invasion response regulator UvrY